MRKALVTGAGGYLAGSLIPLLHQSGYQVTGQSRRPKPKSFPSQVSWIQKNITDENFWETTLSNIDFIFHLAAQTSALWSDENPSQDREINVLPIFKLIETAQKMRVTPVVIFAGSATQCGIPKSLPVSENHPDNPITVYDRNKTEAEQALLKASKEGRLKAVSLRLSNLYGHGTSSSASDRGILNKMASRVLKGETLSLFQETADRMRDYLSVEDAAESFKLAAEKIDSVNSLYFYIGTGTGCTIGEAFYKLSKSVTPAVPIEKISGKIQAIDKRNFIADPGSFRKLTGWKARYSLDQGIQDMLKKLSCAS